MKIFVWIVVALVAIAWVMGRLDDSKRDAADAAYKAEVQGQQLAQKSADDAENRKKLDAYPAERPAVLAKAQKLLAAHKYRELSDMGFAYAWAGDTDLNTLVHQAEDKLTQAAMVQAKAERKKQGVAIGASKQDVLDSSWGRPDSVNTTTTARGTHEQWVYSSRGRGFLYFDDEILTAIQN